MLSLFVRGGTKGNNQPTVATAVASSSIIALRGYGWGAIRFNADPGTVTVYARCGDDDTWAIAKKSDKNGGADLTFTPGATQPMPLDDDIFYYNEIKLVATNVIVAANCHLSLKC